MRRSVVLLLTAAVVAFGPAACSHSPEGGTGETQGDPGAARSGQDDPPIVVFEPEGQPRAAVLVEVVSTSEDITRGLMYRRELGENRGMLFLMRQERVHSFWMRNTYIPLDMIFIGRDRTVAGVVADTTPLTEDSRRIDKPSYYVLEVNAGWSARHHVTAGTPARFKNIAE